MDYEDIIIDIDKVKPKTLISTEEWRTEAAQFEQYGYYTNAARSKDTNSKYMKYWLEQSRRCVQGYNTGKDYIPGYYYFYLNFCPIIKVVKENPDDVVGKEEKTFPDVWDMDYYYYTYLDEAEKSGKHAAVVKTRRRGYSFKAGSMLCRNFYLIPGSNSWAIAYDWDYLISGDGLLTKAWDMMDFIDKNTAWSKRRQKADTSKYKRASYEKDIGGVKIEQGFKSNIIGLSLKDGPGKIRGKRGRIMLFDESGKNPYLKAAWNIAHNTVRQDKASIGMLVAFGTGGTEGADFLALEDMFRYPRKYHIMPIRNYFEPEFMGKETGFFVPDYFNMLGYMDKDGNSDIETCVDVIKETRKFMFEQNMTPEEITRAIAENPVYPSEALMSIGGNMFPVADLRRRLSTIEASPDTYYNTYKKGQFIIDSDGRPSFVIDMKASPIWDYPFFGKDTTGCVVIYEEPQMIKGEIPYGIYIAGTDPYQQSVVAQSKSLASTFVMNRLTGRIVCEYTGRPLTDELYYEQVRRILLYYNAKCNYENNIKGMFNYFHKMHHAWLLSDTPKVIYDKIHDKTVLERGKGTPATAPINKWALELILTWLMTPINYESGLLNLHKIPSAPLLKELMNYNKDGNFDRVSALGMLMIQNEEDFHITVAETQVKDVSEDEFWDRSLGIKYSAFDKTGLVVIK